VKLPLLLSVPHAGLRVPPEAAPHCVANPRQILEDSDEGAAEIYDLAEEVEAYRTSEIARCIVDLNRDPDDRRPDGVVKTHTCLEAPVYETFPPPEVVDALLSRYHRPYHRDLKRLARPPVRCGIDCHTMLAKGPPIGPGPGLERPWVCLSNASGTCPPGWISILQRCFQQLCDGSVTINNPFKGGFIIRAHACELPWIQLELSRGPFAPNSEKRHMVLTALSKFCHDIA
jgi:N-formylglutamate amidohydrolase